MIDFYEKNKTNKLRRGRLKDACEEVLDTLGGAFERALSYLENNGTIRRHRDKKETQIIFDIIKVRNLRNILSQPRGFSKTTEVITQEDLEGEHTKKGFESIWEMAVDDIVSTALSKYRLPRENQTMSYGDEIVRKLIAIMTAIIASRSFEFDMEVTGRNSSDLKSEDTITQLAKMAYLISLKNPQESFKITIGYHGISNPPAAMEALLPEIAVKTNPHLLEFCKEVLGYEFGDRDKHFLAKGDIGHLSPKAFDYLKIFWRCYALPLIPIYSKLVSGQ